MTTGAVTTVVSERDGFCEGDIETQCARDGHGHLGDFECVSEPRSLVIIGEDEDLGLSGEATERSGVQDAISISFET